MPKKGGKKSRQKSSSAKEEHNVDRAVRTALKQARGKKEKLGYVDSLQTDLASIGLVIRNVRSDGNCLFGALSDQLYGTQDRHDEVRDIVTAHMASSPDEYRWFVDEDRSWDEYLTEMKQEGTWGGNIEIQAASMALRVNIVVHQCDPDVPRMSIRNWGSADGKPARTLHLAYHGAEHYNSVRLRSDIVHGKPAMPFDLDCLVASGGQDAGEVALDTHSATAVSASAKAAVCPDLPELHSRVCADLNSAVDLNLQSAVVSRLLKNTTDFPGRTRAYVADLLRCVHDDAALAIECLNRIAVEVPHDGTAASTPPAAAGSTSAQRAAVKSRLSNKQRRALKKAAKYEQAVAQVEQSAAAGGSGGSVSDKGSDAVQRAIEAAAAASLQRGTGKRVADSFSKQSVDI